MNGVIKLQFGSSSIKHRLCCSQSAQSVPSFTPQWRKCSAYCIAVGGRTALGLGAPSDPKRGLYRDFMSAHPRLHEGREYAVVRRTLPLTQFRIYVTVGCNGNISAYISQTRQVDNPVAHKNPIKRNKRVVRVPQIMTGLYALVLQTLI